LPKEEPIKEIKMNLFEIVNNVVTFSPQALMIGPFKKIWDADESEDKINANLGLAFIYYMSDERSDFMHILDDDERAEEIKKFIDLPLSWNDKSKEVVRAIHYYEQLSVTTSTKLLQSTRLILQKIGSFLDNVNMEAVDERTKKPIHDITKITSAVEKIPKLIKALSEIEKEVIKEKELKAQSGNRTQSLFDDGGI
tara:strand:- start:10484 stop:11071 length:588 start_codon:yes stop_codon:yes gene_type:complete